MRSDLVDSGVEPKQLKQYPEPVSCQTVIADLPRLRSGLTRTDNSDQNWLRIMRDMVSADWWASSSDLSATSKEARRVLGKLALPEGGQGDQFVPSDHIGRCRMPKHLHKWLVDPALGGACNHESKSHMESDIHRYVFAACHTRTSNEPLRLVHFPKALLPNHENVTKLDRNRLSDSCFADRFAVQAEDEPARTIVSHIAKDGHYFIHPDPSQGRSLSVREAARIQTFPDNFYFPGPRTEQYRQVGNAVPPFLALQIARIIDDAFIQVQASR